MALSKDRLGRFTASRISDLFPGPRGGSSIRDKYIFEKAQEVVRKHAKQFSNKNTDHGHMNELEAGKAFADLTGLNVVYLDQKYFPINSNCGATPDFSVDTFKGEVIASVDVKCPTESFFEQKMLFLKEGKPGFQNCPKQMFYQGQMQMMALRTEEHYLVRYMTAMDIDYYGEKIEYDLDLNVRLFYQRITKDPVVQEQILEAVEQAAKERDLLVEIMMKPIITMEEKPVKDYPAIIATGKELKKKLGI